MWPPPPLPTPPPPLTTPPPPPLRPPPLTTPPLTTPPVQLAIQLGSHGAPRGWSVRRATPRSSIPHLYPPCVYIHPHPPPVGPTTPPIVPCLGLWPLVGGDLVTSSSSVGDDYKVVDLIEGVHWEYLGIGSLHSGRVKS